MTTLDQLAIKHKADKSSLYHNFAAKYDKLLSPFRDTFTNVLEIGVGGGQSVKMWADYFPNATIHGADIEGSCNACESYSGRIKFHQLDQGNVVQLSALLPFSPFDLIIDDGNHWWREQIVTFTSLFPMVKSGGIYVVEDSVTAYWKEYKNNGISCIDLFKSLIDDVNLNGARGSIPVNPSPDFGNWEQGWHRREDCFSNLSPVESIHFLNSLIVAFKR